MRCQLLTGVCALALIAFSANAADGVMTVPNSDAAIRTNAAANVMSAPSQRGLPVARDGEVIDSVGGGATEAALPIVQNSNGISYITGGVGEEELAALKEHEADFNVRLLATSVNGEYMSEVAIRFLNKQGEEVFRVESAGPFLYVNLPVGTYTVEAVSSMGTVQKAKVVAREKAPATGKVVLRFNE